MREAASTIVILASTAFLAATVLWFQPGLLSSGDGLLLMAVLVVSIIGLVMVLIQSRGEMPDRVGYPRCGRCGYNLTGHAFRHLPDVICPECGYRIAEVGIVEPGEVDSLFIRRRELRRMAAASGLFVVLAAAATVLLLAVGVLDWRVILLVYVMWVLGVSAMVQYARSRRRNRYTGPSCPHCGHTVVGNTSGVCPECGNELPTGPQPRQCRAHGP